MIVDRKSGPVLPVDKKVRYTVIVVVTRSRSSEHTTTRTGTAYDHAYVNFTSDVSLGDVK